MKYVFYWFSIICAVIFLGGCASSKWEYEPITNVEDVNGLKVGVILAWETDYYLSLRKDIDLYRYDTIGDMIIALSYNKIDVMAVDDLTWRLMEAKSDGLTNVEPALGKVGYMIYLAPDCEELKKEFNEFLKEYKKTDEYEDFLRRKEEFDGENYIDPDIPLNGKGDVIRVAVDAEAFPRTFDMPGEKTPTGFDVEAIKRFANEKNYRLEFTSTNFDDMLVGLFYGEYDIAAGYVCDIYRKDAEFYGLNASDSIDESSIYLIQKTKNNISVNMGDI